MDKVKIGIIGCGGIANGKHMPALKRLPDVEMVAFCDIIEERAVKAAEKFGVEKFYTVKEMLNAHPELDIVDVTTSGIENGSWHYVPVMEALAAGKHVLTEKPISNDIEEAREMVRFACQQDLYLGCNLNHYFSEPAFMADKLIADGQIGEQVYALTKVGFNGSTGGFCH